MLVLSGFVPASYVGYVAATAVARGLGTGGVWVSILVVVLAVIPLAFLGGAALGVAEKWPRGLPVVGGAGLLVLSGLSIWMLISLEAAREGLFVFGMTVVALGMIALFIAFLSPHG